MIEHLEPERLDLDSLDIAAERQAELLRLFPEVRTEGGKVDFDRLRLALGQSVDVGKERYGMNWPGKADCFNAIQRPSLGTLLPVREESVNFDETENLIIEGDNLEVLKLLQKSYQGKVKMIYIDPPYNTGNDFIYPDDYSESLQTYLEYTGQLDSEGKRFSNNLDSDGRFHSKWLNMIYPRLFLAKNLLREDGLIFISIDDCEVDNLRKVCDEIFGEENFLEMMVWKKRYNAAKEKHIVSIHEYVLIYARERESIDSIYIPPTEEYQERYFTEKDEKYDLRGGFRTQPLEAGRSMATRENLVYLIPAPDGTDVWPKRQWVWGKERSYAALAANELKFSKDREGNWSISSKQYQKDGSGQDKQTKAFSIIEGIYTQHGTSELTELLGSGDIFPFPKPHALIKKLIEIAGVSEREIILDFFAGSGTSAHAILELNNHDQSDRKFILVQLPEPTGREEFKTIADITKERVRRVIQHHEKAAEGKLGLSDKPKEGFRVLKLAPSNFTVWNASTETTDAGTLGQQLELHTEHILPGRFSEDLLYEILLKSGFPLTTRVDTFGIEGKAVYSVANGAMLICLEKQLTHEAIKAIAERKPERVVCLDEGFAGNDQLKTNAVLIMRSKGVTKFQTI